LGETSFKKFLPVYSKKYLKGRYKHEV